MEILKLGILPSFCHVNIYEGENVMNAFMKVQNLHKIYGDKVVLNKINFDLKEGEFLSVLGPSGCGKTTLLKLLIGIESQTSGKILLKGNDISQLNSSKRNMGIVFHNYALFPNMTVLQNIEYALKFHETYKKDARKIALEVLEQVGLTEHMNKRVDRLSGGQQQRIAIARTLALKPDVILFDEPLSALDAANRLTMRQEIKRIQKEYHSTIIYITHDQEEAFTMSDRIMVMSEGHVEQLDTPLNIYNHPKNDFVNDFVVKHLQTKLNDLEKCMVKDYD